MAIVKKAMERNPTSFPQVFDTAEVDMFGQLRIQAIPVSFILDKQGVIRYREVGYDSHRSYDRFKEEIERLIAE